MSDFIEVHVKGKPRLINLRSVEDVWKDDNGNADIYFTYNGPYAAEQYHIVTDETYEEIRRMVWR